LAEWLPARPPRPWDLAATISEHALRASGRLAPLLAQAAAGLALSARLGDEVRLLDPEQQRAAADLLDDPLLLLERLRDLPVTLLHGNPAPHHWRVSLFHERKLLDWQDVSIGPSVADLMAFVEQADLIPAADGGWSQRADFPASEETIIDGYLLGMSQRLGRRFNARLVRQALPAARCLHVLTFWLPRLADWLRLVPGLAQGDGDRPIAAPAMEAAGLAHLVKLQPYLAAVFTRFLAAYRSL
jgi:hypothetical protein